MHATSTRPPATKRRMMPPAARTRSLGASLGTINSPLKRYTSLTVDDRVTKLGYCRVEFAKISLSIGYDNGCRHSSIALATTHLSARRNRRRRRERHCRWRNLCHLPHLARDGRVGADRERYDDRRGRAELPRGYSRI